ncbi:MAG: phage portal protein [Planctomycetes bacterium]|nr:phage portal protein [Planctomycetota bacterium]
MLAWLRNLGAKRRPMSVGARAVRFIRAKFDSAQTTPDNRRHWANADYLAADAAASPDVRRTLRSRARYEVANNSYARGIVLTLANDVTGTGPRLQMLTDNPQANREIEREFGKWAKAVGLAERLRTMRMARAQDGEAFAMLVSNGSLASAVTLDLRLIEADQVTTPNLSLAAKANAVDGIVFDASGNPVEYHVLKAHPGSDKTAATVEYDHVPADAMLHWFRTDRPGQSRGLPDILPALPLFAQLRRYTLAVIAAAESAANIAIFMKTTAPAGGEAAEVEPMATMEFEPNLAVFGPEGWEPSQIRAEQPATTYGEFKHEILNEIARCLNMPFNVAAGNSSGYNYASGRLDHQTYFKSIRVEQAHLEDVVLDRVLDAWLREAVRVPGLLPLSARAFDDYPHQWFWDGHEHVDPAKEATAQATRLANHTTTLASEYAKQGRDWEAELHQRAKEVALMKELGLTAAEGPPKPQQEEEDAEEPEREAA